jgi:RHS repeat-associated protein
MVDRDGIITTFAGSGTPGWAGDGGLATRAYLYTPNGLALTPDGALLITELTITHVRKVAPQYPGFSLSELVLPSEDGSELYIFQYSGRHLRTLNALTGATLLEFAYDDAGLLVSMTDGDGNLTQLERDTEGRLTGFLSPYGQRTQVTLDDQGYLASLTNPASETISVHATPLGLISSLTDARGASSFYTYDEFGRLVQVADRNGAVQTLVRTQLEASDTIRGGYQVALTSALGRTTTYRVERLRTRETRLTVTFPNGLSNVFSEFKDGSTRLHFADGTIIAQVLGPDPRWGMLAPFVEQMTLKVSSDLQAVVESSREALLSDPADPSSMQTLTETISLNGHTSTLIYAAASQAFTATTSEGRSLVTTIDAQGRPLSEQYGDLLPFVYTYDARGRLETITQGSAEDERRLVVTYEPSGFPDTITDPLGQVTAFDYDLAGRLIQETLPAERVVSFIYDDNGNLASLTPPSQPEHAFTYSPLDLVEAYLPPPLGAGSDQTLYAYNPDRQLTSVTRPDLAQVKLGYDSGGRLASITIPRGTTTLEYNLITGSLQRLTAPDGGEVVLTYDGYLLNGESWFGDILGSVDFVYNSDLRLSSLSLNNTDTISYTYDGDSLPIQVGDLSLIYAPATGLLAHTTLSGVTDGWAYNTFGEQSLYTASFNSTLLYQTRFTRDRLGRITQQQETLQGKTTTYDYSYDQAGQLWQVRQDGVLVSTYLYDPNGNRLSYTSPSGTLSATYDDQDRLLTYGDASYTYTANGELLTKTEAGKTTHYTYDELGNLIQVSLPDGTQIEYLIDGLNRPIGKRVDGSLVQGFLYQDNLKPIAELDGDGNIVSRFVYATHLNVPDYMIRGGVTYRILTDHLGSPRLVVNAATGAIAQRMDFDEFGNVLLDTNPGFQPFGFAGGISDLNTGLIRFGERDYDANVGRWNSKDPIGFIAGDTDLYAYVWNNPVNVFDPSGMDCSGRVTNVEGQVFMSAAPSYCEGKPVPSGVIYVEVKEGDLISGGTTFITGRRSRLTFVLQDGAQVAIGGKQSFNFKCTAGSEKPLPQPQLIHWLRGFLDYIIMGSEEKSKPPERGMWGGGVRG